MLSGERHYGGSRRHTLSLGSRAYIDARTHIVNVLEGFFATVLQIDHDFTARPEYALREGRPQFIVVNRGGFPCLILNRAGATLLTLAEHEWVMLMLVDAETETWAFLRGMTHHHASFAPMTMTASGAGVADEAEEGPTEPFCFEGDDCEYLSRLGQEPLDGDGRPEVAAPMYQDVAAHASNYDRELVRAADVVMPSLIPVRFTDGEFSEDENHPWSGVHALSVAFFDALYKRESLSGGYQPEPHVLAYDAELSGASVVSRHWHHLTRRGIDDPPHGWHHGDDSGESALLEVVKHVWVLDVPYGTPAEPEKFTLQIRLIMEHALDGVVRADCNDPTSPAWDEEAQWAAAGALFTLCVATDELNPDWVDGVSTFQAVGDGSARTYSRADPAVSGIAFGVGGTADQKFVHPQCVILGTIPTSFEAPVGRNFVPLPNRSSVSRGLNGRNLERMYDVPNGAPWVVGGECDDVFVGDVGDSWPDDDHGIMRNVVFGHEAGAVTFGRAITLGGDMLGSKPPDWIALENGAGVGRTFLKPARAGWDEGCGKLTVAGGSSASIMICVSDGDCPIGVAGCGEHGQWPVCEGLSLCDGHPAEPHGGVGGSHHVFRNRDQTQGRGPGHENTTCCVAISTGVSGGAAGASPRGAATIETRQQCTAFAQPVGDYNPGGSPLCDITKPEQCSVVKTYVTGWYNPLHDYTFAAGSVQTQRAAHWAALWPDPDHPSRTYEYDETGFTAPLGTWTPAPTQISVDAVEPSGVLRALLRYDDTSEGTWDWFGTTIECRLDGVDSHRMGLGFFDANGDGVGISVGASGADLLVEIVEVSELNTVRNVLASELAIGEGANPTGVTHFSVRGTEITAFYVPSGSGGSVLSASSGVPYLVDDEPDLTSPEDGGSCAARPSLFSESATAGAIFDQFAEPFISDDVRDFVATRGALTWDTVSAIVPGRLSSGWDKCEETINPECGVSRCRCTQTIHQRYESFDATHDQGGRDIDPKAGVVGCAHVGGPGCSSSSPWSADNPTYAGGPFPERCRCSINHCGDHVSRPCTSCGPASDQKVFSFSLPRDPEAWDVDSECVGDTPYLCFGIDEYLVGFIDCD